MTYKIIVVHGNLHYKVTTLSYLHCTHTGGSWSYSNELHKSIEVGFATTIQHITQLSITAYQELSLSVTHKLSAEIALFIQEHQLEHTIDWVAYNGIQVVDGLYLGNAALLAANIKLPVVAELYSMHQALLGNNDYLAVASLIAQVQPTYSNHHAMSIAIAQASALRWREEYTTTHDGHSHIGGCIWLGVEA